MFRIRSAIALLILAALTAAYFYVALTWSYSSGERAGWIQKLSNKGWVCKTWEGELALVSLPGTATVEKFYFTVRDDKVAADLTALMGRRVTLHYEEKVGLPTSCFGETRHFVTKVSATNEMSNASVIAPNVEATALPNSAQGSTASAAPPPATPAPPGK